MVSRFLRPTLALAAGMVFALPASFAMPMDCGAVGGMHGGGTPERRAERIQQHQKRLHDALKLTPEQEGAWKKFTESLQPARREARAAPEDWEKLTAPERAEKMLDLSKRHQENMVTHVAALKDFYAVLTPEQKKTFDDHHRAHRNDRRGARAGDKAAPSGPGN